MRAAGRDAKLQPPMFKIRLSRRHHPDAVAGSGGAAPALDEAALGRLRQLDPDGSRGFLRKVLGTYEGSLQRHLATLAGAAASGDLQLAGDVAHTLKSSSASVGAIALSQACAAVERLARAGDGAALGAALGALRAEGERVLAAVRAMLPA